MSVEAADSFGAHLVGWSDRDLEGSSSSIDDG